MGSLQAQALTSFCATSVLLLVMVTAGNVWLTLRMADRDRQAEVNATLTSLRSQWQQSRQLPQAERLRRLQERLDQLRDGAHVYVLHLGPETLLLPANWSELPETFLRSKLLGRHVHDPEHALINAYGEPFEIRTYPFADGQSHVHVAHNLSTISRYLQDQQRLSLALLPIGLLMAVLVGVAFSRRVVRPILSLDAQLAELTPDSLQTVMQDLTSAPTELRHHTRVLQQLLTRLSAAWDSQRLFVSAVNHELRNSLMITQGNLRWLQRSSNQYSERQKLAFASALDENRRLSALVSDLLDISRADFGRLTVPLEPVELISLLHQCAELVIRGLRRQVSIEAGEQGPAAAGALLVMANADRLMQVVMNLLENAAKYSPAEAPIALVVSGAGERVHLDVVDQGVGISEADRAHIFERFYRAAATATTTSGTGLGLSLSRLLVEAMDGSLDLLRSGPQGSVFRISLMRAG